MPLQTVMSSWSMDVARVDPITGTLSTPERSPLLDMSGDDHQLLSSQGGSTSEFEPSSDPLLASLTSPTSRLAHLSSMLHSCTPSELVFISSMAKELSSKRDILSVLPPEIGLYILSFVDDPITLLRVGEVSRRWRLLADNDGLWRGLCWRWGFGASRGQDRHFDDAEKDPLEELEAYAEIPMDPALEWLTEKARTRKGKGKERAPIFLLSHQSLFKKSYTKILRWQNSGTLLRTHHLPMASTPLNPASYSIQPPPSPPRSPFSHSHSRPSSDSNVVVVTSLALDSEWVVVGLANSRIHVFSAHTGVLARTLVGHDAGVWGVGLVSAGGNLMKDSAMSTGTRSNELCDALPRTLRAAVGLDADTDTNLNCYSSGSSPSPEEPPASPADEPSSSPMPGSAPRYYPPELQSTPSFASRGWGQPNALVVSGGCDKLVRVWDVKSGHLIYTLRGHTSTIRCLRTLHSRPLAITGARDGTLRTWDIQRGVAIHVLEGHDGEVRCVDVNGVRAVSGGYDACARIWDLDTGECLHVLRGHRQRIYSIAFDGERVATGSLDTSVRVWDADTGHCLALLQDHRALVCALQISRKDQILVSGDSDGGVIAFSLADSDSSFGEDDGNGNMFRTTPMPMPESNRNKRVNPTNGTHTSAHGRRKKRPHDSTDGLLSVSSSSSSSRVPSPSPSHSPLTCQPSKPRPYTPLYRLLPHSSHQHAHTASITSLQFNRRFLLTSSNDGCVHLWETRTGRWVRRFGGGGDRGLQRNLNHSGDVDADGSRDGKVLLGGWEGPIWKVGFDCVDGAEGKAEAEGDTCVIAGKRSGKSVLEIWGFGEQAPMPASSPPMLLSSSSPPS